MTTSNIRSIQQDEVVKPLFESFQWHHKEAEQVKVGGAEYADLAGKVKDITRGCAVIMELIEFDYLQSVTGGQLLMSDSERGDLKRLAIQSLKMLNQEADNGLDWVYDNLTDKAGRGK